jgi:hypothetical protein
MQGSPLQAAGRLPHPVYAPAICGTFLEIVEQSVKTLCVVVGANYLFSLWYFLFGVCCMGLVLFGVDFWVGVFSFTGKGIRLSVHFLPILPESEFCFVCGVSHWWRIGNTICFRYILLPNILFQTSTICPVLYPEMSPSGHLQRKFVLLVKIISEMFGGYAGCLYLCSVIKGKQLKPFDTYKMFKFILEVENGFINQNHARNLPRPRKILRHGNGRRKYR